MRLGETQDFASPEEALAALAHISEAPWSNFTKADYTLEQWHAACLIHTHDGEPTSKSECKLPVKTPAGVLNRNGVHAAAAALAGARGGLKGVSADQKKKAGSALKRYYAELDDDLPESLAQSDISHHGVKGMRWGVRKEEMPVGRDSGNRDSSGRITSSPKLATDKNQEQKQPALSEKKQRRVEKFQMRSDIANTQISELKLANEALQGTRNLNKRYEQYTNKKSIKDLEKSQKRALRDAEAVKKGKLTSTQKKLIIGGVVVTGIVAYAAVARGQQSGALNSYKLLGQARLRGQKIPFKINGDLSKPMSASALLEKVVKPVNPGYSTMGGKMNCRRSTYVYELRRRGFDVHATTSAAGWGQSESGVINAVTPGSRNFYRAMSMSQGVASTGTSTVARGDKRVAPIAKILLDKLDTGGPSGEVSGFGSKKVFEALGKQPNGARGEVLFKFPNFGHSMAYEIVDGKPHIFDSQKGTYHDLTKTVEEKWGSFSGAEITRLDNANLDLNFLTRWATNN